MNHAIPVSRNRGASGTSNPAIRIYFAFNLERDLARMDQRHRAALRQAISAAAMIELVREKRGPGITYHAFSVAGCDLVLCASWQDDRACLKIEVDLRTDGMPLATIATEPHKHRRSAPRRAATPR